MRRLNTFYPNNYNHIYLRSVDGGVIFYEVKDRLTFMSVFFHYSRKYRLRIASFSIMHNHYHTVIDESILIKIRRFIQTTSTIFTDLYNKRYNRKGPLFSKPYGLSQKYSEKHKKSVLAYSANNPVEKHLVSRSEEYPWTFIAYCHSPNPYSPKIVIRKSSFHLKNSLKAFDGFRAMKDKYLNYAILDTVLDKLKGIEKDQMIDHIISSYNNIDYSLSLKYYGQDYNTMVLAFSSNAGYDYEIDEKPNSYSDLPYDKISDELTKLGYDIHSIVYHPSSISNFSQLESHLRRTSSATTYHVQRYFHLEA